MDLRSKIIFFVSNRNFLIKISIIAMLIFILSLSVGFIIYQNKTSAQVAYFYPATCLGGWSNPQLAAGKPDVTVQNRVVYNEQNSATVFNTISQIFCGGFEGEIPKDALYKKVSLHFSWMIERGDEDILLGDTQSEEGDEDKIGSDLNSEIKPGEIGSENDSVLQNESEPVNTSVSEAESGEQSPQNGESDSIEVQIKEDVVETSSELDVETQSQDASNSESEAPVSFFQNFVPKVVYAEDIFTQSESIENTFLESTIVQESDLIVGSEIIEESSDLESNPDLPTEEISKEKNEIILDIPADNALLEVKYTLDGTNWESLGYVYEVNNKVSFDLPLDKISNTYDINNVQIALQTISNFDDVPMMYLDSVWIEVDYDPNIQPIENSKDFFDLIKTTFFKTDTESEQQEIVDVSIEETDPNILTQDMLQRFSDSIVEIRGVTDHIVIVKVKIEEDTYEIWLFDMNSNEVKKIATQEFMAGSYSIGVKNGNIFWLNTDKSMLYVHNLKDSTFKSTAIIDFKPDAQNRFQIPVPFDNWTVIIGLDQFYFDSIETGEVLSDGYSDVNESFIKRYNIDKVLSKEQLNELGIFIEEL